MRGGKEKNFASEEKRRSEMVKEKEENTDLSAEECSEV